MLGVEDLVDHRQRDVLVAAAVTGDDVRVEQFVVVGAGRLAAGPEVADRRVGVAAPQAWRARRCARCRSGTHGRCGARWPERQRRGRRWPPDCPRASAVARSIICGNPFGPGLKWPYGSVTSSGTSNMSVSTSWMPSMVRAWVFTLRPVADVADVVAGDAGRTRRAVVAVEHLAGRDAACRATIMYGAGTPGATDATCRSGSGRPTASSCSAAPGCRRPCPGCRPARAGSVPRVIAMKLRRAAGHEQRIVRAQRDEHRAAALGHEVQPVIEELAEEHEHQVERRRQAEVRRDVRDEQRTR